MGRIYTVPFVAGTVTNAGGNADLWEITPADDKPVRIRGIRLGQTSEVGDAAEESVEVQIIHHAATVTSSNGSSVTPVPVDAGVNVAAGFAAEINGATVSSSSTTSTVIESMAWNLRQSPFEVWYPDKDFAPTARQAAALVVRLISTVADDVTFCGTLWVEEE
ncbi:MAG: hypothetical protein JNJ77_20100 [Planctomycetia bacterium]|nr:hypothetical protein [Planctomycetia bacterium]